MPEGAVMLQILQNYTILYVEDEPDIQANIAEYLQSYFGRVLLAQSGEEALEHYKREAPDVLLLDINLPGIDGLKVAKKIRSQNGQIKIVMLTAYTEKEKLLAATELKLTKYLIKPVEPRDFKETMQLVAKEIAEHSGDFVKIAPGCIWDNDQKVLRKNDIPIPLSPKEDRLIQLFIDKKGETVTYADIMLAVWDDALEREISIDSVKNRVSQLRKKLGSNCLHSVYGIGYILK